jgi:hypothetical protein
LGASLPGRAFLRGEPSVADLRQELEQLGPLGLWRETTRRYLSHQGFVQSEKESFAETMARALGINTDELSVCIAENRIADALLERFRSLKTLPKLRINAPLRRLPAGPFQTSHNAV